MSRNKPVSTPQEKALWLLRHPAEYGRRVGYTLLTDRLHGHWMREIIGGDDDMTLQSHRGSYKTSCLAVAIAEIMITQRWKNVIFLRKTDNDVAEVLQAVRSILLHPLTQAICQVLTGKPLELYTATNKKITTSLYTRTGGAPQLLGIGLGGSLTGKHADIIITDDIVNRLDRQSRAERERTKQIYQELQNLRNPGGRIINSGTPWHKEDAFTLMPPPERYDCYTTGLLTDKQRQVLSLHCEEDLSLGEIAEEVGISRQAVHETITRAAARLNEMETSLGMAARFRRMESGLEEALSALKQQDYHRAEELLTGLLALDQEDTDGL